MDINELKTGARENKPAVGKNIDGGELRDFGNGLKEFDPVANGFEPEKKEIKPDDATAALQEFDKQMADRRDEMNTFNELIDQYGGEISEEELREELGQSKITKTLNDGSGGKFEDNPNERIDASKVLSDNANREDTVSSATPIVNEETVGNSSELDELERELEEDDSVYVGTKSDTIKPFPTKPNIVEEKPIVKPVTDPTSIPNEPVKSAVDDDGLSEEDKDLAALDDDYEAPTEDFDEKLKAELSKKLKPVTKKFDLTHATVVNKPVTVGNALNKVVSLDRKIFTWSLLRSKRPITMKRFTAVELNNLNNYARNESRSREAFKVIWDHIVGEGKGKDFDTWTKCTSYFDVEHIWFCLYGACFDDANYLPFTCSSCNEVTVSTDIPVLDMCKYDKPEIKDEMMKIRKMPASPKMGNVFAEYRVQVSDSIVVGFKEPSIYDAVIAPLAFDSEFRQKYSDIVGIAAYIANIYVIEESTDGIVLRPIAVKQFVNNEAKTNKAKIIQYAKIIRSLSSDQYNIIVGHISSLNDSPSVTYGLPEITCDHCGKVIPAEETAAADLVFMRHRLAILGV